MRAAIVMLAGALALSGCGTPPPPAPGFTQQEFDVP